MKKSNEKVKLILTKLLEHFDYYNNLAPFPLWDSYYTEKLRQMIKEDKINYDEESVDCCGYCKNIHSVEDEQGNYVCSKCKNIINDEFETFDNIYLYIEKYGDIWDIKNNSDGNETG